MLKDNKNQTKNFTRGGQITLHNIRMWIQISNKIVLLGIIVFLIVTSLLIWVRVTSYERYVLEEYLYSQVIPFFDDTRKIDFVGPNGQKIKCLYKDLAKSKTIKDITHGMTVKIIASATIGLTVALFFSGSVIYWLRKCGEKQTENVLIKGDYFEPKEKLLKRIAKLKIASDFKLGGLPVFKMKEVSHFIMHGTTGSGKSTAIKELLDQIRKRGDRAIIYDKSCNFLEEFYQPTLDALLNPLDPRAFNWDLWLECRDSTDFYSLAAALIPLSVGDKDPFWVNAARMIFASAAYEMRNDKDRSAIKLLKYLLTSDLDVLEQYLKGTLAETLVSRKTDKTAMSIKSVLATHLRCLKYVKEGKNPFSIRKWIQNDNNANWLFITSLADRHDSIKPLISVWLDIAVNALLSLPINNKRRIWFILDEIQSLHQLPYLTSTLSEARKFGGCFVIGLQSYAQLQKLYGEKGAEEISSLLNNRYLFKQPDPTMANWSAMNFGETIVEEVHESISYGANTLRDGISFNRVETRKPLLSYSEFMSLADLFCYVRLPDALPVTKIEFKYKTRERSQTGFIMREIDENLMKEIDLIADKYPESKEEGLSEIVDENDKEKTVSSLDVAALDL